MSLARAGINSEGTIDVGTLGNCINGKHWKPKGNLRDPKTQNSITAGREEPAVPILQALPVQVIGKQQCEPSYHGTD
jgi:hypothetical protein